MRILIDAMSGDHAPDETVKGTLLAAKEYGGQYVLIGNRQEILRVLSENGKITETEIRTGNRAEPEKGAEGNALPQNFSIVDTDVVVTMEDSPIAAVREKRDSSMGIGLRMLAEGKGDAFVSAGNTGALYSGAVLVVRSVRGIRRPAIASILPFEPPVLLLDSGANVNVTPEYLSRFGLMGSVYMQRLFGLPAPRVGLLNNGEEACKGTQLQVETHRLLCADSSIRFVGNVEACRVPNDVCDVLVADGFSGNVLLKSIEGMGALLIRAAESVVSTDDAAQERLSALRKRFDVTEHGGAPILGLKKPVIKAHGSSGAYAFKNAVGRAIAYAETGVSEEIADRMEKKRAESETEKKNG